MNKLFLCSLSIVLLQAPGCTSKTKSTDSNRSADMRASDFASEDTNRNRVLELSEVQDHVGKVFHQQDKDRNGILSETELGPLRSFDLNADRSVTVFEVMDASEKKFTDADKSNRGFLTEQEAAHLLNAK